LLPKTLLPAKAPAHLAAGPYGHPTHPIAVMAPIGAWVSSLALDLLSRRSKGNKSMGYAGSSRALIGLGLLGAGGAALTGLLDYTTIPRGTRAKKLATAHLVMNVGAVASYTLNFFGRKPDGPVTDDSLRRSVVTLGVLGVSGFVGGELAYRYGVRVADEGTQARGFTGSNLAVDPYASEGIHRAGNVAGRQRIDPY
jgi:uncharacterized membrane protein